jgi:hypothetical protein
MDVDPDPLSTFDLVATGGTRNNDYRVRLWQA